MRLKQVADSTEEPVSLSEAKRHLKASTDLNVEDSLITDTEAAARQHYESQTRRSLVNQDWTVQLEGFPTGDVIELPRAPLASSMSSTNVTVRYFPSTGGSKTLSGSSFFVDRVDAELEFGRVVLKSSESWPSTELRQRTGVEVDFTAGYGGSSDVPQDHKHAIKLLTGHWYEHREAVQSDGVAREVPQALNSLIWQNRVPEVPE